MNANNSHHDLIDGTAVTYDGRAQGIKVGRIQERIVIDAYRDGDPDIVYYAITTSDLLVPADDILGAA